MKRGILLVVFLSGCASPWVHQEYGRVNKGDDRLDADWAECARDPICMEEKGWAYGGKVWVNPDVPPESKSRQFRMDQAKCRTVSLTTPFYGNTTGQALLGAHIQDRAIMSSCMEGLGWQQVRR